MNSCTLALPHFCLDAPQTLSTVEYETPQTAASCDEQQGNVSAETWEVCVCVFTCVRAFLSASTVHQCLPPDRQATDTAP